MILIKIKVNEEEEFEVEWKPDVCTDRDIDSMCYAIKRFLREAYGRSPQAPA